MKFIVIILTIIFTTLPLTAKPQNNLFHVGATLSKENSNNGPTPIYGAIVSYDRYLFRRVVTLGTQISEVTSDYSGEAFYFNFIRLGFHPIYINRNKKKDIIDPYILFIPFESGYTLETKDKVPTRPSNGGGVYAGINGFIGNHLGVYTELGYNSYFEGTAGLSIRF